MAAPTPTWIQLDLAAPSQTKEPSSTPTPTSAHSSPVPPSPPPSVAPTAESDDSRPFACPHCPRRFYREHNLTSHLYTHKPKLYRACSECGAAFRRWHDLLRHVRAKHSRHRPYSCHVCGAGFSRADSLKKHLEFEAKKGDGQGRRGRGKLK
ncbi:hypothetical protein HDU96_004256 [Phlyctochytrium bullatum]|nr:hypothetical protein HDU96_004256 [Phlyctochytrium bullatum]